ncbi:phosphotransferase [Paenibacillus sp. TAB 01]|uniref:phosphotransferase n=1 Tax=Paenibacillus sp. TAB 01 TaxID=3368988 RepID=UPI00375324F9
MTTDEKQQQLHEVLQFYFDNQAWRLEKKESGVNNTTLFVYYQEDGYVLRIYDNHEDENKVKFELAVLEQLQRCRLSFQTPRPVKTRAGDSYVRLRSGKLAVLFRFIEGERAELDNAAHVFEIGRAMGELVTALAQVQVVQEAAYEPYYDLEQVHSLVTRANRENWLSSLQGGPLAKEASLFQAEVQRLEDKLPELKQLPVQLVHSDIVGGNIIARGGEVSGILDFEFVTPDLRAMEAAVFLNELIRCHGGRWELVEAFAAGYGSTGSLEMKEVEALPQLILLRSLVLCLHFLGRQWAIGDQKNNPETFLASFGQVHAWLERNRSRLAELLRTHIGGERI